MSTSIELAAAEAGGLLSEDVIKQLFITSKVERPFLDAIGTISAKNTKKEWTDLTHAAASASNTMYENQDLSALADNAYGNRYYNICQPMKKVIKMSQRGRDVETTYGSDEFLKQVAIRADELKKDEEAAFVSRNPVTEEVADTSGALMAGAATWTIRNASRGTDGEDAVLDGTTGAGGGPTTAPVEGDARGFTETLMRAALRAGWDDGVTFTHLMSTGDMIENIANYLYTSTARVAAFTTDVMQSNRRGVTSGAGASSGGVVAQGAVNMFVGNFGSVTLTPNRQMTTYTSGDATAVVDVLFFDPAYCKRAVLHDYDREPLAKTGLYDQVVLFVDSTLVAESTYAITTVADVNPATAMAA